MINENISSTKKIKNNIFANPVATPAIPPKPRMAAMSAITKSVSVQRSIFTLFTFSFDDVLICTLVRRLILNHQITSINSKYEFG